jgi:DnaJ-class molecular chaperone
MMKYVMTEIDCPECGGEGYVERMTWLTYDGAQTWQRDECPECSGDKFVTAHAECRYCGQEILTTDELDTRGGKIAHADCSDYDDNSA